jgi:hypothetical protein
MAVRRHDAVARHMSRSSGNGFKALARSWRPLSRQLANIGLQPTGAVAILSRRG